MRTLDVHGHTLTLRDYTKKEQDRFVQMFAVFRLRPTGHRGESFNELVHLIADGVTRIDSDPVDRAAAYKWVWKLPARALIDSFDDVAAIIHADPSNSIGKDRGRRVERGPR